MAGPEVEFVGYVDETTKRRLLAEEWFLLHPAMHEGWGLAITQAAAHGTPAIRFDVEGVRDAVANRETGLFVTSEVEFAGAWLRLVSDTELRSTLGQTARASPPSSRHRPRYKGSKRYSIPPSTGIGGSKPRERRPIAQPDRAQF